MTDEQNKNNFSDQIPVLDGAGRFAILGSTVSPSQVADDQTADYQEIDDLVDRLGLKFNDEILQRRFINIVLAWRKGIRNSALTLEALKRPPTAGGLGFDQERASAVLQALTGRTTMATEIGKPSKKPLAVSLAAQALIAASEKKVVAPQPSQPHVFSPQELEHELAPPPPAKISAVKKVSFQPTKPALTKTVVNSLRDVEYSFKTATKKKIIPSTPWATAVKPMTKRPSPVVSQSSVPRPLMKQTKKNWWQKVRDRYRNPAVVRQENKISSPPPPPTPKRITDIHLPDQPTIMGPVEELKNFRLVDWRRLAGDPQRAADKIKAKIDLLEEEAFTKKIAGIQAWRQSEVYRLYVMLGQQSLEQNKSVEEIIAQRTAVNQPTLTTNEFSALAKLHSMLEY